MTSRLFLGIDLNSSFKQEIIDLRDKIYGVPNDLRWEEEEKLHITLKFLGDVGDNISDLLIQRLQNVELNKFKIKLNAFSFFKKKGKLSILFASIYDNPQVFEIQRIIEDECELVGFEKEKRKFHPHITLLRLKGKEDYRRLIKFNNKEINIPDSEISSFSLYESILQKSGSEYFKRKSFYLV